MSSQTVSLPRDANRVTVLGGVSSADNSTPVAIYADPVTHRLLVSLGGSMGTVTSVSVVSANGFAGTVATATTTPAITLSTSVSGIIKGNGTALSAAVAGDADLILPTQTTNAGKFLTTNGTNSSWATVAGGGLTVGTTTITSGTTTRVLYDNAGVLGEYTISGSGNVAMTTSPSFTTPALGSATGASLILTGTSANILAAGANGTTNPVLNVDASAATVATGLTIQGKAAGNNLQMTVSSSGANENLYIDAKGAGIIVLNNTGTGVVFAQHGFQATGGIVSMDNSALALAVGPNGNTNPTLQVDSSTASSVTGLSIKSAAAAAGVALSAISSGINENLKIDAKGSGTINLGSVSTGIVQVNSDTITTLTATQTLTNKTLTTPVINQINATANTSIQLNAGMYMPYQSDTDGATVTFDLSVSNIHTVTLGGNRTLVLSNANIGQAFILRLKQDATGSRTVTWFSGITWAGGLAPTLSTNANYVDTFGFLCTANGAYDGYVIGQAIH